jgi:hypothetical protein
MFLAPVTVGSIGRNSWTRRAEAIEDVRGDALSLVGFAQQPAEAAVGEEAAAAFAVGLGYPVAVDVVRRSLVHQQRPERAAGVVDRILRFGQGGRPGGHERRRDRRALLEAVAMHHPAHRVVGLAEEVMVAVLGPDAGVAHVVGIAGRLADGVDGFHEPVVLVVGVHVQVAQRVGYQRHPVERVVPILGGVAEGVVPLDDLVRRVVLHAPHATQRIGAPDLVAAPVVGEGRQVAQRVGLADLVAGRVIGELYRDGAGSRIQSRYELTRVVESRARHRAAQPGHSRHRRRRAEFGELHVARVVGREGHDRGLAVDLVLPRTVEPGLDGVCRSRRRQSAATGPDPSLVAITWPSASYSYSL